MIKSIIDAPKEFYDVIDYSFVRNGKTYLTVGAKRFGYTPTNPDNMTNEILRKRFARQIKKLESVLDGE